MLKAWSNWLVDSILPLSTLLEGMQLGICAKLRVVHQTLFLLTMPFLLKGLVTKSKFLWTMAYALTVGSTDQHLFISHVGENVIS